MRKNRIAVLGLTVIALMCVLVSVLCASVYAVREDYSPPGALLKTEFDSADILELALGSSLDPLEREYLSVFGEEKIVYGSHIPASVVSFDYRSDATLSVSASEYVYVASSGASVKWIPKEATLLGETKSLAFTGEAYVAEFSEVSESDTARLEVKYSTEITISRNTVNALINKAIDDVGYWESYVAERESEYASAKLEYDKALSDYEDYIEARAEYESAKVLYNEYLTKKRIYDEALAEYNAYLSEMKDYEEAARAYAEYQAALAKYNEDYQKYTAYLAAKDKYDAEILRYNEYLEKYERVKYQLSVISGTKNKSTSHGRSVYNAIIGDTVTMVIENKDLLTNQLVDVNEETIATADRATKSLRSLYEGFFAAKTEAEQYAYYVVNYEAFKTNFTDLLRSLDEFYSNGKIRVGFEEVPQLKERNMKVKYEILIAQLFYVVNAISDEVVYNNSGVAYNSSYYFVYKAKTPYAILENSAYMKDSNTATPIEGGYPTPVPKPSLTVVSEPTRPTLVQAPVKPEEVENPGEAPTPVDKPVPPTEANDPGTPPEPYVTPDAVKGLFRAKGEGKLVRREEYGTDLIYTPEITVTKKVFGAQIVTVRFYDFEKNLVYGPIEVERGTYAEFVGDVPTRPSDAVGDYTFSSWGDEDGNPVSLAAINPTASELSLYPIYDVEYKSYNVTWYFDGKETVETYQYGELPVYSDSTEKPDDARLSYTFKGWNTPIVPVTGDMLYVATFDSRYLAPVVGGKGLAVKQLDGDCTVDARAYESVTVNISNVLTRAAFSGTLTVETQGFSLKFSYSEVIAISEAGAELISIGYSRGDDSYSFGFKLFDSEGRAVSARGSLSVPFELSDPDSAVCYYLLEEKREYVRATFKDGVISISAQSGNEYHCRVEYPIEIIPPPVGAITPDRAVASAGETVTVALEIPEGYVLSSLYVISADGTRTPVSGCTFTLPAGGASIGMELILLEYRISFVSEGKIISEQVVRYGETPTPPTDPTKASDGVYVYRFVGWTPEIGAAFADATYTAVYEGELIPEDEKPDGPAISPGILKALVAVAVAGVYGVAVFLPFGVILTVRCVRASRRKVRGRAKK